MLKKDYVILVVTINNQPAPYYEGYASTVSKS